MRVMRRELGTAPALRDETEDPFPSSFPPPAHFPVAAQPAARGKDGLHHAAPYSTRISWSGLTYQFFLPLT